MVALGSLIMQGAVESCRQDGHFLTSFPRSEETAAKPVEQNGEANSYPDGNAGHKDNELKPHRPP